MLTLCSKGSGGGAITASLEEIAFRLRMTIDELVSSFQPLIKSGFSLMLAAC